MTPSSVLMASDHAGVALKASISEVLTSRGLSVDDLGTSGPQSVDYPDIADRLVEALLGGSCSKGILICGTGIGIGIAANRHRDIRAAICHDVTTARFARAHNDANILCLGARIVGIEVALDCVNAFLETPFEGGRHQRRLDKLGGE